MNASHCVALAAATMLCSSCTSSETATTPAQPLWTPQTAWRLTDQPLVTIGDVDRDAEHSPLDPVGVLRMKDGTYLVADGGQVGHDALMRFDAAGKWLRNHGRPGNGPGEFYQLYGLHWFRGDSIAARDTGPGMSGGDEIFAADGTWGRLLILDRAQRLSAMRRKWAGRQVTGAGSSDSGFLADGSRIVIGGEPIEIKGEARVLRGDGEVIRFDADGKNSRVLRQVRLGERYLDPENYGWSMMSVYYFGLPSVSATDSSGFYFGIGDTFAIDYFDGEGKRVRTISRPFEREPLTTEQREAFFQGLIERQTPNAEGGAAAMRAVVKLMRMQPLPERKPAYSAFVVDAQQNLWVQHYDWPVRQPSGKPTVWSVFDPNGRWLGEITVPRSFLIFSITADQVLGFQHDEFGQKQVRAYGLIKP